MTRIPSYCRKSFSNPFLRRRHGLRQRDVPGLSERQIRRYERGTRVPFRALRLMATAHGMELNEYLNELADKAT